MKTRIAALTFVGLAATLSTFADVPDLTAQLEYLGNPNASRWPSSSASVSRHVQDLVPYKGRIYTSGGDWNNNTGPCSCFAVDPYSGAFTNEFEAGTDAIFEFKEFSDGRLYASAVDMHEGALHNGSSFRRGSNDVWVAYTTACTACNITNFGSSASQGYRVHSWDMAEYKGYTFVCGYGISASTNWCEKPMFDASPQLRDLNRPIDPIDYRAGAYRYTRLAVLRRFCAFLPFDDDIFCFPIQPVVTNDIQHCDWEEWRWDESSRTFLSGPSAWENVAPGITEEAASFSLSSNAYNEVQFWHPTKFGSRVLYILGEHGCNIAPWAAYSAENEDHHVKATKIDLGGDDVKPFDICVADGAAYIVAAQAGLRATMVTNSVWKSTDGVSFEKLFTFVSTRQVSAICYYDGCFYLGMGSNSESRYAWPKVTGTDVSGRIYRVRLPQHEAVRAVAEPASVSVFEGESTEVSFRLDSAPATNMTLRVWTTNPQIVTSVSSLTFTPSDWNVPKTVQVSILDDEIEFAVKGAVVCGTGGSDCFSGAAIVESVEDDGGLTTPTSGSVTAESKPYRNNAAYGASHAFDGNRSDTNGRWVAVYTNHMYAVYRFNEATAVNMLRIWNGDDDHGGWNSAARSPKAWTFEASNDGENWTVLDTRTNETEWSSKGEARDYTFTNDTAYAYYKFDCTELNGATDYLQLWELEFYYIEPDAVLGAPPDLTDALEYLGNPNASRWPSSALARHVQDLVPYQGKIFTSGGEWGKNLGPCPCFAVDPHSGGFVDEFDAGTDSIYEFKEFSDGRLHASAVDMHEGAANLGSSFRRETDGTWRAFYTGCGSCNITNFGSMAYEGYKIHSWDMAEFNGTVFLAGYGISASTNWCEKAMFDATPQLRDTIRYMGSVRYQSGGYSFYAPNYSVDRRFCAFLPFDDDIFCFPIQPAFNGDIQHFDSWEEWRWNASAKRFECQENSWSGVAPGLTAASASLVFPSNGVTDVQLWHPTKFGCRVLYILGDHTYNVRPWAAYSAVNENHHVKATKIDLGGDDVKPFDVFSDGAAAYIVAAQAGLEATLVTNSVWKSTDGLSFTKMFTFVSTRHASAICRHDGFFYLGMGSNDCTLKGWPKVKGTDVSGRIYRVRDPSVATTREVVAESAELSVAEGGNGVARFRLSARPDADFTAPVSLHSGTPAVTTSVRFVTFTTSDWNQWHEVPFVASDDDDDATAFSSITCGAGSPATAWAATVKINVANNDVRVVETPPEGLVDLTSPEGDFESTGSAVTMAPFNDDTTLSSTSQRVCIQKTSFYITYKFAEPTVVDAYGIYNLKMNSYVERAPKAWTFRGSNDGTTWTPLDARRYEIGWTAGEYRYYSFSNAVAFTQYRLDFTANNGDAYTQFAHLEFYRTGSGSSGGGDDPGGDQPGGGDEPEPSGGDGKGFAKKTTLAPSASALGKIGDATWANFPVLLRLPESVSSQFRSANGTDLLVEDENGAELPFEVETFNPAGTTFVWVKVPALSSATVLTVHFGGAANTNNDPTAVWSRYAGVWHFAPSAAGTMTVPDATGNGLAGATTNELSSYEGPAGLGALLAGSDVQAPDYDARLGDAAQFSASGWFKAPAQESAWWTVASKKVGITTGPNGENLWNIDKGWYLELPQSRTKLNLNYTTSARMTVPDAAANWNYFQIVSDGSTLKVYLNGSSTPAVSKSYTVKASGTPYQMCRGGGCSREYRMRKGAASAAETALEYATMADASFFVMGAVETLSIVPVFGGEGVPAPALGVDSASGAPVFSFAIGNAVKGAKYRIYKTESLTTPFEPYGDVIEAGDSGILNFVVPTADEPSCFFKIVAE